MSDATSFPAQHQHVFLGSEHDRHERRTWLVVGLTSATMVAEIVAGTVFGSMALVADGWHMSTHAAALGIAAFAPYMVYRFISFVGFDLYQQMGTEQEAKNALNRPIPVPAKPTSSGEPKKVLEGSKDGGAGGGSGGAPPPPSGSAPTAGTGAASSAGTGAGASGTGAGAGAGAGAGVAAGPAAAVVVGAQVVKGAAEAGPKAGHAVAGQAETAASAAGDQGSTAPAHTPPPPSAPQPRTPAPSRPAPPTAGRE